VDTAREDLGAVCRAAAQLDALCEKLGVQPLSSFVDEGDVKRQLARIAPEVELDGHAAAAEGHPVASGLETVTILCELLMSNDDPLPPPPPSLLEQFMLPQVPTEQREAMMRWLNRRRPQLSVEAIVDELQLIAERLSALPDTALFSFVIV
jgi:hypothetical protein